MSKNYKNGNNFTTVKYLFFIFFYLNVELNSLQIHRGTFSKISILFKINVKYSFFYFSWYVARRQNPKKDTNLHN